jgi:hypothetical protein
MKFGSWVSLDLEGGQFCPLPAFSRLWPPKKRLRPRLAALQTQTDPLPEVPYPGDRAMERRA